MSGERTNEHICNLFPYPLETFWVNCGHQPASGVTACSTTAPSVVQATQSSDSHRKVLCLGSLSEDSSRLTRELMSAASIAGSSQTAAGARAGLGYEDSALPYLACTGVGTEIAQSRALHLSTQCNAMHAVSTSPVEVVLRCKIKYSLRQRMATQPYSQAEGPTQQPAICPDSVWITIPHPIAVKKHSEGASLQPSTQETHSG